MFTPLELVLVDRPRPAASRAPSPLVTPLTPSRGASRRLASGADALLSDADGETALHKAASQVRRMRRRLTDPPLSASQPRGGRGLARLTRQAVVRQGHAEAVRCLLAAFPQALLMQDRHGQRPPERAVGATAAVFASHPAGSTDAGERA
jgi:hypothetical protein